MASLRFTELTYTMLSPAAADILCVTDVSDTSEHGSGTSKKLTLSTLVDYTKTIIGSFAGPSTTALVPDPISDGTNKVLLATGTWTELADLVTPGETNIASNTGTTGTGVYKTKTGSELFFYKIASANALLTVALSGTDYLKLTLNEASIDHDNIANNGSNDHAAIDSHIAATAAHGATGAVVGTTNTQTLTNKTLSGATINASSNTITNIGASEIESGIITGLTTHTGNTEAASDTIMIYDSSLTGLRKITIEDLFIKHPAGSAFSLTVDKITHENASAGTIKTGTLNDWLALRSLTIAGTASNISSSLAGAQTLGADRTWTLDLVDAANDVGTYTNATVTVDVKGRVTDIASGTGTTVGFGFVQSATTIEIHPYADEIIIMNSLTDAVGTTTVPTGTYMFNSNIVFKQNLNGAIAAGSNPFLSFDILLTLYAGSALAILGATKLLQKRVTFHPPITWNTSAQLLQSTDTETLVNFSGTKIVLTGDPKYVFITAEPMQVGTTTPVVLISGNYNRTSFVTVGGTALDDNVSSFYLIETDSVNTANEYYLQSHT